MGWCSYDDYDELQIWAVDTEELTFIILTWLFSRFSITSLKKSVNFMTIKKEYSST